MSYKWNVLSKVIKVEMPEEERKEFILLLERYDFAGKLIKKFRRKTFYLDNKDLDVINVCYYDACNNLREIWFDDDLVGGFVCNEC